MEAADRVELAVDGALVAGEEHADAPVLLALVVAGPHHLAPLAVHELAAARKGLARPREVRQVLHLPPARQRRRRLAAHLRAPQPQPCTGEARPPPSDAAPRPHPRTTHAAATAPARGVEPRGALAALVRRGGWGVGAPGRGQHGGGGVRWEVGR